ncbi:MAG TPA: PAS domain-containing protein, partial [Xanthobacteraceae bacterium]
MPDTIRTNRSCLGRRRQAIGRWIAAIGATAPSPAGATEQQSLTLQELALNAHRGIIAHEIAFLALIAGVVFLAVVATVAHLRARGHSAHAGPWSDDEATKLREAIDRANALLLSEPQVVIDWPVGCEEPGIEGDPAAIGLSAAQPPLAFGGWLDAGRASAMACAVDALRARGEPFAMTLTTLTGHPVEAQGRAVGGHAILRLKDASGIKRELVELIARYDALFAEVGSLRALVETLPSPVWTRNTAGQLTFVNAAYARAVEAKSAVDVVERRLELLDNGARESILRARLTNGTYSGRLRTVIGGARRTFDVLELQTDAGSAGVGVDATDVESMRSALVRLADAHRRTLDQLSTGVAMFDARQRLTFYNDAYRALWDLDAGFLDQQPTDSTIIESLRTTRKLPEQQDFRQWKARLHEVYRATEPTDHTW